MAIIAYLTGRPRPNTQRNPRCMSASAIGSLYNALQAHLSNYVGLTISLPEMQEFSDPVCPRAKRNVLLANKHDPRASILPVPDTFDLNYRREHKIICLLSSAL